MEGILLSILMLGLAFAGIAIKIWAKKGGEFAGTCASSNPMFTKEEDGSCSFCGARSEETCKKEENWFSIFPQLSNCPMY